MASGDDKSIKSLTVPFLSVIAAITIVGGVTMAYSERESTLRTQLRELQIKSETNAKDVKDCQTDIKNSTFQVIEIKRDIKYLVDKVDEISSDIKEHKKSSQ